MSFENFAIFLKNATLQCGYEIRQKYNAEIAKSGKMGGKI